MRSVPPMASTCRVTRSAAGSLAGAGAEASRFPVNDAVAYHRQVAMTTPVFDVNAVPAAATGTAVGAGTAVVNEGDALSAAASLFRALGDPSRLTILRHLALGEHRVVDLMAHLGLAQSTVSKHLACLRGCGLVASRPQGRASVFSLTQPELVTQVLAAAEGLLAATGDAVTLCPTSAPGSSR